MPFATSVKNSAVSTLLNNALIANKKLANFVV